MDDRVIELRRNMRRTEMRIKEFCARQVPTEIFHYTLSQMRQRYRKSVLQRIPTNIKIGKRIAVLSPIYYFVIKACLFDKCFLSIDDYNA